MKFYLYSFFSERLKSAEYAADFQAELKTDAT